MKQPVTFTRWHRYTNSGVKIIRRFELNTSPYPIEEEGYSPWVRGTGDFSPQALDNLRTGVQRACKGVPKPETQKQKMREAKLGVPKTEEHKQNMKRSWHRRKQRELNEANTNTTTQTV